MRRMKLDAVPHGFRSTFKDWAAEETDYPNALSEMALAHKISNDVEAAYRRGDMFEKRRAMMQDWATLCATKPANKVVHIRGKGNKG
jgi:integrase